MPELQDRDPVVNTWQFHREGHRGQNYAAMEPDDFPSGMTLNVPREGINPHEFAKASAREKNLHNAWELTTLRAQTAQKEAIAAGETGRAVHAQIGAATQWQDVATAKIGLEMAGVNTAIAQASLNIRTIELEVVEYQEQIKAMSAPVRKAQFLIEGLTIQEQFYSSAAELIQARTDRDTQLGVLGIQGYNTEPIPMPDIQSLPLPNFEFPALDQVLSSVSQQLDLPVREV